MTVRDLVDPRVGIVIAHVYRGVSSSLVLDGKAKPTQEEFNTIAGVLGITGSVSNQSHSTPIVY